MNNQTQDPKFTKFHGVDRANIDWHPTVDESKCIGCGLCVATCGRGVYKFDYENQKSKVTMPNNCMVACQTCSNLCPTGAIGFAENGDTRKKAQKIIRTTDIMKNVKVELETRKNDLSI